MLSTQLTYSGHQLINQYFTEARREIARLTHTSAESIDLSKPVEFSDYPPQVRKAIEEIYKRVHKQVYMLMTSAVNSAWLSATSRQSELSPIKLSEEERKAINTKNLQALADFKSRKVGGLNLSERVWQYVKQEHDISEVSLRQVLTERKSYQETQRKFLKYLNAPEDLIRMITERGNAKEIARAIEALRPGTGVYRDPIKNIQRMLRTEINRSTKTADWEWMQRNPYVIGYEIRRNKRDKQLDCEMCDKLQGRYPKEFKFTGWHPQCECTVTPIFADPKEQREIRRAIKAGRESHEIKASTRVTELPPAFHEVIQEIGAKGKPIPYAISDALAPLEAYNTASPKPTAIEVAQARHTNRTPEQISDIQKRWDERQANVLVKKANEVKEEVQRFAEDIAPRFGAIVSPINLKSRASIVRKLDTDSATHDIFEIKDSVRTTIVAETNRIPQIIACFYNLLGGDTVKRIKIQGGGDMLGYTGAIVNIQCSNGILGEIQINSYKMIYAKEKPEDAKRIIGLDKWEQIAKDVGVAGGLGHQYYEKYRVLTDEQKQSAIGRSIKKKSEQYYSIFNKG